MNLKGLNKSFLDLKLIAFIFVSLVTLDSRSCTNEETLRFFEKKYELFLSVKFFLIKEPFQGNLCKGINSYNNLLIESVNQANNYFASHDIISPIEGNCNVDPFHPTYITQSNFLDQLEVNEEVVVSNYMKKACSENIQPNDLKSFFEDTVEKLSPSSRSGEFFQSIRAQYYKNQFQDAIHELPRLKCNNLISSNACQFPKSEFLDNIFSIFNKPNISSINDCAQYKEKFCSNAIHFLRWVSGYSIEPYRLTAGTRVAAIAFSRFGSEIENIDNSSDLTKLCFYQSINEQLGCDRTLNDIFAGALSSYSLTNLLNSDAQVTKENCKKEGILIENDHTPPRVKVFPNPVKLSNGHINIQMEGQDYRNCYVMFNIMNLNGVKIQTSSSWVEISASQSQIPLPSTLESGSYLLNLEKAKCNDREIDIKKAAAFKISVIQ
jgi:hypothetical protein